MKIALSGLHSQGKTTLLNELNKVDLFKHFTKIPSPTRILQSEGFKINENGDETTQACIMMQHLKNVLQFNNNAIFDRCALDGYAYGLVFKESLMREDLFQVFNELFHTTMKHYDVIFYVEPELELVNDSTRSLDVNFFNEVKDNFEFAIKHYNVNVKRVKGSIQERVDFIKKTINIID